jgi:hypothetical protein
MLKEKVIGFEPGKGKKKYIATVYNIDTKKTRRISFGHREYQQWRDSTPLGLYSTLNHGDRRRRRAYFTRHSGVPGKTTALRKEIGKSGGLYNAKILSHKFLW